MKIKTILTLTVLNLTVLGGSYAAVIVEAGFDPPEPGARTPITRRPLAAKDLNRGEGLHTPPREPVTPSKREGSTASVKGDRSPSQVSTSVVHDLGVGDSTVNGGREAPPERRGRGGAESLSALPVSRQLPSSPVPLKDPVPLVEEPQEGKGAAVASAAGSLERPEEAAEERRREEQAEEYRKRKDEERKKRLAERSKVSSQAQTQMVAVGSQSLSFFGKTLPIPTGVEWLDPAQIGRLIDDQYCLIHAAREAAVARARGSRAADGGIVSLQRTTLVPSRGVEALVQHLGSVFLSTNAGAASLLVTTDMNDFTMFSRAAGMRRIESDSAIVSGFRGFAGVLTRVAQPDNADTLKSFKDVKEFLTDEVVGRVMGLWSLDPLTTIFDANKDFIIGTVRTSKYSALVSRGIFDSILRTEYKLHEDIDAAGVAAVKKANMALCLFLREWDNLRTTFGSICMLGAGGGNGLAAKEFYEFLPQRLLEMVLIGEFRINIDGRDVPVNFNTITTFSEKVTDGAGSQATIRERMVVLRCAAMIGNSEDLEDPYTCTSPFAIALYGKEPEMLSNLATAAASTAAPKVWWKRLLRLS